MKTGVGERLRDKTRDKLCSDLQSLGIVASMAERKRCEEKVPKQWHEFYKRSLGIIDLHGEPVRFINILKRDRQRHTPPKWWMNLGIPDENPISESNAINIRTRKIRSLPVFGKVIDVVWSGDDKGTGLADILAQSNAVDQLSQNIGKLRIFSYNKDKGGFQGWVLQIDRRFTPNSSDWTTIRWLAEKLVSMPRRS